MDQPPTRGPRVSAVAFPDSYVLPAKPDAPAAAQDAYRQTQFLLGDDLRLFEEGMNLQLRVVREASHSSVRTHAYAALMGLWSRTFLALSDACLLSTRGSYPSCPALVRAACEYLAAQKQLHESEMEVFLDWLADILTPNEEHKAFEFGLGRFFAGEALASDERLRRVYRPASELGRPNFGATLLEVGPESSNRRLGLTFGDATFHFGWAQLVLGWLLALCERQLAMAPEVADVLPVGGETRRACVGFAGGVERTLAKADRCSIDEVEEGPARRFLVRNFRRVPSGDPKKILL